MTQKCGWPNKRRGVGTVAQVVHSREKRERRLEAGRRDSVRLDFYPLADSSGPDVGEGSDVQPVAFLLADGGQGQV